MVALVSFTPCAGGRRGLTIATELSQETGPLVRVTGSVSERRTRCTVWRWWMLNIKLSHRLDSAVLSSDTLLSVHVGDRIVEVNGIPVRNITAEEVGLLWEGGTSRSNCRWTNVTPSTFLQINCVIQDTTKPLQLTIEHNPQSANDLPGSNHPLHSSSSTDGPEKLGPTHKLPSLEEEPNAGQENEPIRASPSPTQCSRSSLGVRSRHVM